MEEDARTFAFGAFCIDETMAEEGADLFIFLNDTLAVLQSEAMPSCVGAVEDMVQRFLVHSFAGIRDRDLEIGYVFSCFQRQRFRLNCHAAAPWSELPCVVCNGVHHEEGQCAVGFHHCIGLFDDELDTLEREAHGTVSDNVENLL